MKTITIASIALSCVSLALCGFDDWRPMTRWIALACSGAAFALAWRGLVEL